MKSKRVALLILDGYGLAQNKSNNAIELARPGVIKQLMKQYPSTYLLASGESVGLPDGEVGNTEVGHLTIGSGRAILQSLPRINSSIADGSFYKNESLIGAVKHIAKTGGKLHLLGLVGEHHVHASIDHLYALLFFCKENYVKQCCIHLITDGRDSPPKAASQFIVPIEELCKRLEVGKITSIMGRYFAMDRDLHWERIEKAYNLLTQGIGSKSASWRDVLECNYNNGKSDEFIEPSLIVKDGSPVGLVESGDAVIFYNFRIDRPRELTKAFVLDDFKNAGNKTTYDPYATKYFKSHLVEPTSVTLPFDRGSKIKNLFFVTMTQYEENLPVSVAFPPHKIDSTLGEIVSKHKYRQLRIAESEKERFVTFYFNGMTEKAFKDEDRLIIPSLRIASYDQAPEMSAIPITNVLLEALNDQKHELIVVNYANADMLGHTGNFKATIKGVGILNKCIDSVVKSALKNNYTLFITGDHGNAEEMINSQSGEVSTEHSGNPVPFIAISSNFDKKVKSVLPGTLADVAPTILSYLGIDKPPSMTGRDLLSQT